MADYQAESGPDHPSMSVGTMINAAGGLVSIALVIGIGFWGYKMVARDVSGVPVVRAASGAMRVAPENPGGTLSNNMGLAVNKVAAEGVAEKPADRLVLAPPPVQLTLEDSPQDALVLNKVDRPTEVAARPEAETPVETPATDDRADDDAIAALTASLLEGATPLSGEEIESSADGAIAEALRNAQNVAASGTETAVAEEPTIKTITARNVPARSLRPKMRPAVIRAAATTAETDRVTQVAQAEEELPITAPAPIEAGLDVAPETIPAGTRLAQLGAYDSEATARKEWDRFNTRFQDYMTGKQRVIQKASSGGRTFYRLRVMGFTDMSAARHFCAALVAANADCIPVVTK